MKKGVVSREECCLQCAYLAAMVAMVTMGVSLFGKLHRNKEETLVSKVGTGAGDPPLTSRDLGYDRALCTRDKPVLLQSYQG